MKEKYIVKAYYCDYETTFFDDFLYDIDENYKSDIFIGFNNEFVSVNFELIKTIDEDIINYSDYVVDVYYKNNLASYIIECLRKYKRISLKKALKIRAIVKDYEQRRTLDYDDMICEILSVIFNKHYEEKYLHGSLQRDWIKCYYSEDVKSDYLNYVEGVFFNTGYEIKISREKHDISKIEDINDYDFEGYYDYMVDWLYSASTLQEIASIIGCNIDEMVVYDVDGYIVE